MVEVIIISIGNKSDQMTSTPAENMYLFEGDRFIPAKPGETEYISKTKKKRHQCKGYRRILICFR